MIHKRLLFLRNLDVLAQLKLIATIPYIMPRSLKNIWSSHTKAMEYTSCRGKQSTDKYLSVYGNEVDSED